MFSDLQRKLFNSMRKLHFNNLKVTNFSTNVEHKIQEGKIKVDGLDINCVQVGNGEHPVLLLPGAMGSVWTDFKPQIECLSRDKFKIVSWDPPGYGKSRPPNRTYPENFFELDAIWGCHLMKALGHSTFSLIGWSDGGITSLILASKFSENVRKMLILGTNSFILPEEVKIYKSIRDIESWSVKMREPFITLYGKDYFQTTWSKWIDTMIVLFEKNNGNICNEHLAHIKCPTLIVHGKKDVLVSHEHPPYLNKHIKNSRVKYFEQGSHNLHLRYPEEFNALATEFLCEKSML